MQDTANLYFKDHKTVILCACETDQFGDALLWEESRGGVKFPHLYTELKLDQLSWHQSIDQSEQGFDFSNVLSHA